MSKKLASLLSLDVKKCEAIANFAEIHINNKISFNQNSNLTEDEKFESLRRQTELGSELISRIQLSRKCEDIVRAALEGSDSDEFKSNERKIQSNKESDIILICELYVTLRSVKSYKRPYNHQKAIAFISNQCIVYFDSEVYERFIKFSSDFEAIYDEV
jgi:response regulator RpfG family c-di-GMP phosphodiesterase